MITLQKLLIAEQDPALARPLRNSLKTVYPDVNVIFDLTSTIREMSSGQADFLLLDADISDSFHVLSAIREIRQNSSVPILLFSAQPNVSDMVRALEAGADDYLRKPLEMRELHARITAIWRRYLTMPPAGNTADAVQCVEYPQLAVNLSNYTVICDGAAVDMPPRELELFYFLASSPNQVFSREQLLDQLWGYDFCGDARTVDVHMKRIRAKIKDHAAWSLDTVWGVGYKFTLRSTYISSDAPSAASVQNDSV